MSEGIDLTSESLNEAFKNIYDSRDRILIREIDSMINREIDLMTKNRGGETVQAINIGDKLDLWGDDLAAIEKYIKDQLNSVRDEIKKEEKELYELEDVFNRISLDRKAKQVRLNELRDKRDTWRSIIDGSKLPNQGE